MTVLHVACVVEGSYMPHCAAMLHSVLAHRGSDDVHVHYLHGPDHRRRSGETLAAWLRDLGADITFYPVPDAWCEGLPVRGFTGKATWYRIFLPALLTDIDRVLFLDADVIAFESLRPLWDTDLSESYLGAVTNVFEPHYRERPAALGLADRHSYFNAGVLLMNLELLRADHCARALRDYGVAHADELVWRDQDALNVVLGHRRKALAPRWNAMNILRFEEWSIEVFGREAVEEALRAPAIRHFEGPDENKPWHKDCARLDREAYLAHRRDTPWARDALRDRAVSGLGAIRSAPTGPVRRLKALRGAVADRRQDMRVRRMAGRDPR